MNAVFPWHYIPDIQLITSFFPADNEIGTAERGRAEQEEVYVNEKTLILRVTRKDIRHLLIC